MDIESHFIKSNDFKTVQITGAFGGVLGNGILNFNLFTERLPIPQKVIMEVDTETNTVKEKHREGKVGIVREVHLGVLMDLTTARSIQAFLEQSIAQQEAIMGIPPSKPSGNE